MKLTGKNTEQIYVQVQTVQTAGTFAVQPPITTIAIEMNCIGSRTPSIERHGRQKKRKQSHTIECRVFEAMHSF